MHSIAGRTHRTFEEACDAQDMATTAKQIERLSIVGRVPSSTPNADAFLERKGADVIAPENRGTAIATLDRWTIRSYGGRMFDAYIAGEAGVTPGFDTVAGLVAWIRSH